MSFKGFFDGKSYKVIDATPRFAYPCSSLWAKFIKNYADVLYAVAEGKDKEVIWESSKPYYVELTVSTNDTNMWRVIDFSEELKKYIGFRRVVKKDEQYWFVPGDGLVCTVNTYGESLEDAFEEAKKVAEEIKCMGAQWSSDWFNEAKKTIDELEKLGGEFEFKPI